MSARDLAALCPGLGTLAKGGGALWYDAVMSRPEHLTRAFVRSATEHGGLVAKNAWADSFIKSGGRVLSVAIRDCQTGALQEVAASQFALAAGPWTDQILARAVGSAPASRMMPASLLAPRSDGQSVRRGANASTIQPTMKEAPPSGVIAPIHRRLASVSI